MYIVIVTIFILVFVLFGSTIVKLLTSYSSNSQKGNVWFISLLIINIFIILFLYGYNYYISNLPGKKGGDGTIGNSGSNGLNCIMTDPKTIYYKNYNNAPLLT